MNGNPLGKRPAELSLSLSCCLVVGTTGFDRVSSYESQSGTSQAPPFSSSSSSRQHTGIEGPSFILAEEHS
jgi:hypothetical protein